MWFNSGFDGLSSEESLSSMEVAIALARTASIFNPYLLSIFPSFTVRKIMAHYVTQQSTMVFFNIKSVIESGVYGTPRKENVLQRKVLEMIIPLVLTNSMEHSLSEKLIVSRRVKEIPRILRNPEVHYRVHISQYVYLPWIRSVKSTPTQRLYLTSVFNITFPSKYWSSKWSLPLRFPQQIAVYASHLHDMCHIACPPTSSTPHSPLTCWNRGFESHRRHGYLSVVSVVCCQVEVSATSWSLVQRSPAECGASLCVI